MSVSIGVILPTSTPDPERPILGDVRASARFAEELGLESVWSTDHLLSRGPMLDSTVVLATAAAVTERVRIGFAVMLIALRPVAWAAKQISTLQYVSADRVLLGVGTGNPVHGDIGWRAAGVDFGDRGPRTDAALRVLPGLVRGERTSLDGGVQVALAPGANMPPVLVAGDADPARRRAARYGDGWVAMGLRPEELRARLADVRRHAAEYGRPTPGATVVAPILGADPLRAAEHLSEYEAAGAERVIIAPTHAGWRADYEFAAALLADTTG